MNLLEKYGVIKQMILDVMYKHLKESQNKIENIAFFDVKTRLIRNIFDLGEIYGKPYNWNNEICTLLDLKISQDDLADPIVTSRETINKMMHDFKTTGVSKLLR